MKIKKLDETYSLVTGTKQELDYIVNVLKVEEPGAYFNPLVQRGFKSPYVFFTTKCKEGLVVYNGHLALINQSDEITNDYDLDELHNYLKTIIKDLPFKPYDFQLKCFIESILNVKHINLMCTGSGKSLTISLILDFLIKHNKKCLLLVPNINLLTQFKSDIESYNLNELYSQIDVLGGGNKSDFKNPLLISTWQSLVQYANEFGKNGLEWDCLICDECLHPDTLIKTKRGEIPIKDVTTNDFVLTYSKTLEYKPVVKVHKNLSKNQQMYKITMEDERILKITGNHKVYTQRGWIRVDMLNENDKIFDI